MTVLHILLLICFLNISLFLCVHLILLVLLMGGVCLCVWGGGEDPHIFQTSHTDIPLHCSYTHAGCKTPHPLIPPYRCQYWYASLQNQQSELFTTLSLSCHNFQTYNVNRWMPKCSICFLIRLHLEPFGFNPTICTTGQYTCHIAVKLINPYASDKRERRSGCHTVSKWMIQLSAYILTAGYIHGSQQGETNRTVLNN